MDVPTNSFKCVLAAGRLQIGLWSSLRSPIVAEIVGDSGFDWVLLDTEHSPNEISDLLAQMQAMAIGTAAVVVRPPWNDAVAIKRVLDIGAQSILVPMIQTAEEARRAVAACRYPPAGLRGVTASGRASRYGRATNYFARADQEICVLVQVETADAVERIEEIAGVDGVDGVFVGPGDLAASVGLIGQPGHDRVQTLISDAIQRLNAVGKPGGILTSKYDEACSYIEWGFRFVAVGVDVTLLARSADRLAASFAPLRDG